MSCEFCQKFDFSRARVDIRKDTANIELALCNTKFPKHQQFKYCPMCAEKIKPTHTKGEDD